jgi:hypothetical protein
VAELQAVIDRALECIHPALFQTSNRDLRPNRPSLRY